MNFCPHCGGDLRSFGGGLRTGDGPAAPSGLRVVKVPDLPQLVEAVPMIPPIPPPREATRADFASADGWLTYLEDRKVQHEQARVDAAMEAWRRESTWQTPDGRWREGAGLLSSPASFLKWGPALMNGDVPLSSSMEVVGGVPYPLREMLLSWHEWTARQDGAANATALKEWRDAGRPCLHTPTCHPDWNCGHRDPAFQTSDGSQCPSDQQLVTWLRERKAAEQGRN